MTNKGIAIRTILLLVAGILVAGVIIYLVYSVTSGSSLSSTACMSRVISWCTRMRLLDYWDAGGCSCGDATCLGDCSGAPAPTCGTNCPWDEWVSKCVDSANKWNFDPSATYGNYDNNAKTYCPRVGVK